MRLAAGSIDHFLVLERDAGEILRNGEDNMEVLNRSR